MDRLQEALNAAEALYGFCGWLTSRKEKTVMSSRHEAGRIADLIGQFSKVQGLEEPRHDWTKELVPMKRLEKAIIEAEKSVKKGNAFLKSKGVEYYNGKFVLKKHLPPPPGHMTSTYTAYIAWGDDRSPQEEIDVLAMNKNDAAALVNIVLDKKAGQYEPGGRIVGIEQRHGLYF